MEPDLSQDGGFLGGAEITGNPVVDAESVLR